jgi:hypothetical protein
MSSRAKATLQAFGISESRCRIGAYAMACEAALKFKEVANIHAEAFSLAEIMHGPLRLIRPDFPVFGVVPEDEALEANAASLTRLQEAGADLWVHANGTLPGTGCGCHGPVTQQSMPSPRCLVSIAWPTPQPSPADSTLNLRRSSPRSRVRTEA